MTLFVLLHIFFWPLCFLFFFDIRIPITRLNEKELSNRAPHVGVVQSLHKGKQFLLH
jgi:hypothetical protein